jgi:hypothetical protein
MVLLTKFIKENSRQLILSEVKMTEILSDESMELMQKLVEIKEKYEAEKVAFKKVYIKHKEALAAFEAEAKSIQDQWVNPPKKDE